jgi:DNA-binding NarL/FixJ family response regulator
MAKTGFLTDRETQVLPLVAEGLSNPQIGEVLRISPRTAQTHVNSIIRKLSARNRTHAAVLAVQNQLLPPTTNPVDGKEVRGVHRK